MPGLETQRIIEAVHQFGEKLICVGLLGIAGMEFLNVLASFAGMSKLEPTILGALFGSQNQIEPSAPAPQLEQ